MCSLFVIVVESKLFLPGLCPVIRSLPVHSTLSGSDLPTPVRPGSPLAIPTMAMRISPL